MRLPSPPTAIAALAATVALVLGACGGPSDPTGAELVEEISEELRSSDPSLTAEQADCYAELLVDEVGTDEINDLGFTDDEPDPEVAQAIATAAVAAREACGLGDGDSGPTSTTTTAG